MNGRMGAIGIVLVLWSLTLAQVGPPWGAPVPQGPQAGGLYQNPALGMTFPMLEGFQLVAEAPYEGGLAAAFAGPGGSELYAVSHPLGQPMDLQAFHQFNLQRLAQQDQALRQQGIQVARQPLSGLTLGGRPALGVYSQILYQGQQYLDVAVYTVEGGRVYALQLTAPAQVFPQLQPAFQGLLAQVRLGGAAPAGLPGGPGLPGASQGPPGGLPSPQPSPLPPQASRGPAQPAFTPPADRTVVLRYGKEVGDGQRFAVVVGGLSYRISPAGPGRWRVTEVVEDAQGKSEDTYLVDGLSLQEGRDVLLPPVWHTGRTEIAGTRFTRSVQGNLVVYRYQDQESRIEIAYRQDGWLAYLTHCDLTKRQNPCVRYTLMEVR